MCFEKIFPLASDLCDPHTHQTQGWHAQAILWAPVPMPTKNLQAGRNFAHVCKIVPATHPGLPGGHQVCLHTSFLGCLWAGTYEQKDPEAIVPPFLSL